MTTKGKALEVWVAAQLAAGELAGLLSHWKQGYPKTGGRRGRKVVDVGPPDFVAYDGAGVGAYIEAKECESRASWLFDWLHPHQAADLSALPGSMVVIAWSGGATVAVPWRLLAPRWYAWAARTERAVAGTASLTLEQAEAIGTRVDGAALLLTRALLRSIEEAREVLP